MTTFVLFAALLVIVTMALILRPLLRPLLHQPALADEQPNNHQAMNLDVLREHLAELQREQAAGTLDDAAFQEAQSELHRRLLEETSNVVAATPQTDRQGSGKTALLIGLLLPLLAVGGYLMIGNPQALNPLASTAPEKVTQEQMQAMVEQLAVRLKNEPENIDGWLMLGRSYKSLGRTGEAAEAYGKIEAALADNPDFLADYADLLAMMAGGKLDGKPQQLIKKALELDSSHLISLWLAGSAAFDKNDFSGAIAFWERALKTLPPESAERAPLQGSIAEAKRRAGFKVNPAQAVAGRLTLAAAKRATLPATATVFIFARPTDGTRLPLAVAKIKVADLPYDFVLDDRQAMVAGKGISSQSQVLVEARILLSGDAIARDGDLRSNTVQAKVGERKLRLLIQ